MNCPRCSGQLQPTSLRELGLTYDAQKCSSCEGLWISPDQLTDIELTVDQRFVEVRSIPSAAEQQKAMLCPQCSGGVVMQKVKSSRDQHVVMDVCPTCHRVWLDKGEREAIEQQSFAALLRDFFGAKK